LKSLKLSIALLTYNRERFLEQQLESLLAQTRRPAELIIGDDCSTDRTVEIIRSFAARAPFPVHWYINERNYGLSRNAERAIRLCSGDVITFCDDDDVCLPEKVQFIEEEFLKSPTTGLVLGNSALVNEELTPLGSTLWDAHRFTLREAKAALSEPICTLARHFIGYGHVIAFRASLKPHILPFPSEFPPRTFFDVWLTLVLASTSDVICSPRPLVLHRLHGGQFGGVGTLVSSRERFARRRSGEKDKTAHFVSLVEEVIGRVSTLADTPQAQRNLERLTRWADHMRLYLKLPAGRRNRLLPIARALLAGRYHRYSRGFFTAARDLLLLQ
jgi:glycosyltransferase involved in cell wall biosynthesis